jgi:predicted nucleotidyltransferase
MKSMNISSHRIFPRFETEALGTKPNVLETLNNKKYLRWKTMSWIKVRNILKGNQRLKRKKYHILIGIRRGGGKSFSSFGAFL